MDAHWTNCLTGQTATSQMPIPIWKGCGAQIARAIWDFQQACATKPPKALWRAMPALVQRHIEPALHASLSAAGFPPELLVQAAFGENGLSASLLQPNDLDRRLCDLNKMTHSSLAESIDTLREAIRWIEDRRPARTVPTAMRGLKGASRRLCSGIAVRGWPYCAHCGQLSERALQLNARHNLEDPDEDLSRYSAQFCPSHKQEHGGSCRSARRHAERFKQVLRALKHELSIDRSFHARLIQRAWELEGDSPLPLQRDAGLLFLKKAAVPSLITDPVKTYLRKCAYSITRELPDDTALSIARLRSEGLSQSDIARRLGLSRQAVSLRIRKSRGCYDFTRHSPLLYWWPDDTLAEHPRPPIATAPARHM